MSQEMFTKRLPFLAFFLFVIHNFQFISRLFSSLIFIRVLKNYCIKTLISFFCLNVL